MNEAPEVAAVPNVTLDSWLQALQGDAVAAIALIGLLGIGCQWVAWRTSLPAIVLLMGAGIAVGPVLGILDPPTVLGRFYQPFVSVAVAVILFEGGLRLRRPDAQTVPGIRRLCTIGLLLAFVLGTWAAIEIGELSAPVAMVLGAILVVTGPTVILPLLRQARLQGRTAALFLWEGIVNDPLGAALAVVVFELYVGLEHGEATRTVVATISASLAAAAVMGAAVGFWLGRAFGQGTVPEYLKSPTLLAAVVAVHAGANAIQHDAGLLAVTVMGAVLANYGLASISDLTRFKESIAVILVSSVFIVLAADMDLASLSLLDPATIGLIAAFLFVVRPAAVLLSTIGAGMRLADRLLLAWIAPRGIVAAAVAGVFAPRLVEAGYEDGAVLVPFMFAFVTITVVLHGFSLGWMARWLGLAVGSRDGLLIVGASRWTTELARVLKEMKVPVVVSDGSWNRLRAARLADVPVHFGETLSESAETALPLHTVSTALAATDNDAYNSLVCVHFGPELGRSKVFQIANQNFDEKKDGRSVQRTLRGRLLAGTEADYWRLDGRLRDGWKFQRTKITEKYTFEKWRADNPDALPIAVVKKNGALRLHAPSLGLKPEDTDTLLSFGPRREEAAA